MLPTKFRVNWPFGSGEVKYRCSRWPPWRPSWIFNRNDLFIYLFIFWSTSHSDASYRGSCQLAFRFREVKNRFSRWPWRPSLISDRNNLSFFDLQVTPKLPTEGRVNWPFGSGEVKNRFSRCGPSSIFNRNDFILSIIHPDAFYHVSSKLDFRIRRKSEK